MGEKTYKSESNKAKKERYKKHRPVKCSQCGKLIDIGLRIENDDYDKINDTQISVFCEYCDNYEIVKL
jgi:hypothetical protein